VNISSNVTKIVLDLESNTIYDYSLFDEIENRNALYVAINRLIKKGVIKKASKGKFFKVEVNSNFNNNSIDDLIQKEVSNNGVEIGQSLYYKLKLTSNKAKEINILCKKKGYYKKNLLNQTIKYTPLRFECKLDKTNKKILQLFYVLKNKEKIKELNSDNYFEYIRSTCNELKTDSRKIEKLKDILNKYTVHTKFKILTNLEKIDYILANNLSEILKPYQKNKLNEYINQHIESRIFILLNRNVGKEFKYNKGEVNKAFLSDDYNSLSQRGRLIFSKIFKEFDSFDLNLLKKDFYINKENFKKILLSSPYKEDKYIFDTWKECLNIDTNFIRTKKTYKAKRSSRLDKILAKRNNSNV